MSKDQLQGPSLFNQEDLKLKEAIITTDGSPNSTKNIKEIQQLLYKLERTSLIVNRLDCYGNAIPIGAFCNAVTFIIIGFTRCKVFNLSKISFLQGIILIFGSLGQITAGILEFLKARSYSALLYLTLGFYCLSNIFVEYNSNMNFFGVEDAQTREITLFLWAWFLILAPLIIAGFKVNIFFVIQTTSTFLFLLFRWIGEVSEEPGLNNYTCGVFQLIAGFTSLYIFFYQIVCEEWKKEVFPCFAFDKENDIDYNIIKPINNTPK